MITPSAPLAAALSMYSVWVAGVNSRTRIKLMSGETAFTKDWPR
jgi:hypothetical protein